MSNSWQSLPAVAAVQRRTVRLLVAAQIVGGIGIGAGASLGALLAEDVTNSETWAGLARTASTLGAALAAVPLALLATRKGRGPALGFGWATAAVGGVLLVVAAATHSTAVLVLGMLMFGSGTATNLQSRYAATDLAPPDKRARTLSLVVWSTTIGAVLGPNLGGPGEWVADRLGLPVLGGAFVISAVVLGAGAVFMWVLLRPDPLTLVRAHTPVDPAAPTGGAGGVRAALRVVAKLPTARWALLAVVLGHCAMAAVMTMTPVHMNHHGASLQVVGLTISVHVLGMYAFSPLVGMACDRFGSTAVIVVGQLLFLGSALAAGLGQTSMTWVTIGLGLLGLGWSCSLVGGSTLLTASVPVEHRTAVQGASDMAMNIAAAVAAAGSGPAQALWGFGGLNAMAAILTLPVLLALAVTVLTSSQRRAGLPG
ncbi:MFS transporter [Nakamurella aerolata]|uniref:MFS transporter n=1 Tax=Nakamurella aerolata TaxID=1656892 RepID=A0A849A7A6_9ACTN|nr:MFS transporter [Nakamurella aerolata]